MSDQISINHRALIAAAAKLESVGYQGDAYRFVEGLVVSVLSDGYRRLEPVPARVGPGASDDTRRRDLVTRTKEELAERKRNRLAADPNGVTQ